MVSYKIQAIDSKITQYVRETRTDPIYGHDVRVEKAPPSGYGPCRSCLKTFSEGERRLLFLYNPFSQEQESDFAGPVFVHESHCQEYQKDLEFPEEIRNLPISLRGYADNGGFIAEEIPNETNIETLIEKLFINPDVSFIHVRNTEAKCFIMRINRS